MYTQGGKINEAIRLLADCLSEGSQLSNEMFRIAKECGISGRTLERAKRITGVESQRGKNNERIWVMPDTAKLKYSIGNEIQPGIPVIYRKSQNEPAMTEVNEMSFKEEKRFKISELRKIFLICEAASFQGKYDRFAVRVPSDLVNNIMKGDAFVFCDRSKRQICVLQWQGDGYALFFKRAEYGSFGWPVNTKAAAIEITSKDLRTLLEYPRLMLRLSGVSTPFAVI